MYRLMPCVLVALLLALARRYGPQLIFDAVNAPPPDFGVVKPVVGPDVMPRFRLKFAERESVAFTCAASAANPNLML